MRVLVNAISVRTGGAETFLRGILPCLVQELPNWSFCLLTRHSRSRFYQSLPPNVEILAISDGSISSKLTRLRFEHIYIPKLHRRLRFDIHWQVDEMLSPVIVLLKIPSVATFHTTPMILYDHSTGDPWLQRVYARWLRYNTARHATIPVTVSYHAKAELSGLYPFARDRIRVVHHGVDHSHYRVGLVDNDLLISLEIRYPYILSVSNRFPWKNYFRLIQAYHLLVRNSRIPEHLVLVGSAKLPAEEQRIASYLRENNLSDRVHMIDYVEQKDLPALYRSASVYVFPSLRETFGMTVLEAMACGTPVTCARWGPLPEIAGDAAHYFDPLDIVDMAEAILDTLSDNALRNELISLGQKHVRYFTWERAAKQYRRLFLEAARHDDESKTFNG